MASASTWRIGRRVCERIPVVSAEQRAEIAAGPVTPERHAALLDALPFTDAVELQQPRAESVLGATARVVAWNAERCKQLEPSARLLAASGGDVLLLSELDHGMARSGQHHAARELAWLLGFGYAFAVEFLELELGSPAERDALPEGASNQVGYHGNAILSRAPLLRPAVVRLAPDGAWFDGARGEQRVGSRIAVVAQVELAGTPVTVAAVHLESHEDPEQRAAQAAALFDALDAYDARAPVVIGGDLNTFSIALAQAADRDAIEAALRDDPERWRRPERHEPLFAYAAARGYAWRSANVMGEPTHRHALGSGSTRGELKLDWLLVRGLEARDPAVLDAAHPATGALLSDHEPVAATISLGG